jgi:hypothetical protein
MKGGMVQTDSEAMTIKNEEHDALCRKVMGIAMEH